MAYGYIDLSVKSWTASHEEREGGARNQGKAREKRVVILKAVHAILENHALPNVSNQTFHSPTDKQTHTEQKICNPENRKIGMLIIKRNSPAKMKITHPHVV